MKDERERSWGEDIVSIGRGRSVRTPSKRNAPVRKRLISLPSRRTGIELVGVIVALALLMTSGGRSGSQAREAHKPIGVAHQKPHPARMSRESPLPLAKPPPKGGPQAGRERHRTSARTAREASGQARTKELAQSVAPEPDTQSEPVYVEAAPEPGNEPVPEEAPTVPSPPPAPPPTPPALEFGL
jgi:hypothetical protein